MLEKKKLKKININIKIKSLVIRFKKILGIISNKKEVFNIFFILKKRININNDIVIFKKFNFRNNIISKIKLFKNDNIIININSFFLINDLKKLNNNLLFIIINNKMYLKNKILYFYNYNKLNLIKNFLLKKKVYISNFIYIYSTFFNKFIKFIRILNNLNA
jgi:hypothetical protein